VQRLFGIPIVDLAVDLLLVLAAVVGAVLVLAASNLVFARLALRNVGRRRGRSALIVTGLMLATTIIAAALATGDTVSHTIRGSVVAALGATDEIVAPKSAKPKNVVSFGQATGTHYFDEEIATTLRRRLRDQPLVDGVAPAIVEPVAVQDLTTRQTEPAATLFAPDPAALDGFGDLLTFDGTRVSLAELAPGEVYVTERGRGDLGVDAGDRLAVYVAGRRVDATVRDVVRYHGAGSDAAAVVMPLARAQEIVARPGRINQVRISNLGGELNGVAPPPKCARWSGRCS
jgi:putative ABC transport system permease protein